MRSYPKEMSSEGVVDKQWKIYSYMDGAIENHHTPYYTYSRVALGVWHDESNDILPVGDAISKSDGGRVCYSLNR